MTARTYSSVRAAARVARLLGIANVLDAEATASDGEVTVHTPIGPLQAARTDITEGSVKVALRADQIILVRPDREPDDRPNTLDAEIVDEADFGHSRTLYARVPDSTIHSAPTLEIQIAPVAPLPGHGRRHPSPLARPHPTRCRPRDADLTCWKADAPRSAL